MSAQIGRRGTSGGVLALLTTEQRDTFIRALARIAAAASDSAGSVRSLGAGDRPTMHEAAPAVESNRGGFEEDDHREQVTTIDNAF